MLTEESVIDQLSVDERGNVSVRRADRVLRDGEVVATTYHRHVIGPTDPLDGEHPKVKAFAELVRALPV